MYQFPRPIAELIEEFSHLPGVGPKTAERYVLHLLRQPAAERSRLARAVAQLDTKVQLCEQCYALSDARLCAVCRDSHRNQRQLCVVAESSQIIPLEKTGAFDGLYFVLGGVISPIENITPDRLRVRQLIDWLKRRRPAFDEVILAFNPDVEGESTALYLAKLLKPRVKKLTRLARGLPVGGDMEYADDVTLSSALRNRR